MVLKLLRALSSRAAPAPDAALTSVAPPAGPEPTSDGATKPAATRRDLPQTGEATEEDILYCFRLILGRAPSPEEIPGHLSKAGTALPQVVSTYLNSAEFAHRKLINATLDPSLAWSDQHGLKFLVDTTDEDVGKHLLVSSYEDHVTKIFQELLRPGMNVIDVGANIGYFTMLAAHLVGKEGRVCAFEPNARNVALLEASRRANDFAQVTVYPMGTSDQDGLLVLNSTYSNGTTSTAPAELEALTSARIVPAVQLDHLVLHQQRTDFIKIDIEGAEYRALKGAEQILRRDKPIVVSEFSPNAMPGMSGVSGQHYLEFLVGLGYTLGVVQHDGSIDDCGTDTARVLDAHTQSGVDHIDIIARPASA
ncbi:FkbM family methyltransferase [Achromobacter sp. GG226]|uniref:FkbM family methyltransferase n=1 Tax=Verticiella alkaliphila TaxID=2779529 RepID=UPI001C0D71F5|nr:FkbM family methyltransferase [Verticiella sp. GG226]MBU4612096.1 FkbM family methyltransferase [Verticiella sp. GG226]